ncbi:hypothetical protein [Nitrosococcus oceani]|uniref:Acetyltransferase n=2 Tax=Nitrosococcus oceani TaxID=1229 RepID=Q3J6P3_NITOC|nr:hypothetical protein [Nitrosococcus oceani]KFI18070.1 acetyltransferase [Nitrosococcus oceani C-27]ABA59503.1 conserved hypothetical protein [Nitrosococcus oceani ATCC 19707]EDZ65537.1 hypothetical protein NOC27_2217 [Nitrosococcus oceani AFC27]KFI21309.1 acetyltransferase [Nitrosococcus oceani]GEM21369.1 hypothetical protein NONS58_28080 [Nitrosococcus oceani]
MYLKHTTSSDLIEILNIKELIDPSRGSITGRSHVGEEMQEPASFQKRELIFPSGEMLPQCWIDPDYKKKM